MKEVEIKIQVPDAGRLASDLERHGCVFSAPKIQEDRVFIPEGAAGVPVMPGINVLRIRKQGGISLFTLKQSMPGNHLAKLEHELEISSAEEMERIIKLLGFKEIAHITKARRTCRLSGFELCLDRVEELGDFLEIEKITDEDPAAVQEAMLALASGFGIDISRRISVGYDILFVQKNNPNIT